MDNLTYALNLLKNSSITLKYDEILNVASSNMALGMSKNKFLSHFDASDAQGCFRKALKDITPEVAENPSTFSLSIYGIPQKLLVFLRDSVSDLEQQYLSQQVFIALAFRYARMCVSQSNSTTYNGYIVNTNKAIPLVFNATCNKYDTKDNVFTSRESAGQEETTLVKFEYFSKTEGSPYACYVTKGKLVVLPNLKDKIYVENNQLNSSGANEFALPNASSYTSFDRQGYYRIYGNPNSDEVELFVESQIDTTDEVFMGENLFEVNILDENIQKILHSLRYATMIVLVDDDEQDALDSIVKNQICFTLFEGTPEAPLKSVNIPLSGFFAMLQLAYKLQRNKFTVKTVGENQMAIDFSYEKTSLETEYIKGEDGKPKKVQKEKTVIIPSYYVFNPNSCQSTVSMVYFASQPDFEITPERKFTEVKQMDALLRLPQNIVLQSIFLNKRAIVLDSLLEWSRVEDDYYDNAIKIATNYVDKYTLIKKDAQSGDFIRTFNKEIFNNKKTILESIATVNSQELIEQYKWSVEEKYWDNNPSFDIERTLDYFLGMGLGKSELHPISEQPYRILCARILGIDYFSNYDKLCLASIQRDNSELFIDPVYLKEKGFMEFKPSDEDQIKQITLVTEAIKCKSEFVRQNLYSLLDAINDEKFAIYLTAIGVVDASNVVGRHKETVEQYLSDKVKFHFEGKQKDYELLVRNKSLGKAYLINTEDDYSVEDTSIESKISNANYERRRIVIPQTDLGTFPQKTDSSEYFPTDYIWGDGAGALTPTKLHKLLYIDQRPANEVKTEMYKAGVPLSNADAGATEDVYTTYVKMIPLEKSKSDGKRKMNRGETESSFRIESQENLTESNTFTLGNVPSKNTLWTFQEPYLWTNYSAILSELKSIGLIKDDETIIPEDVAIMIMDRVNGEYNKLKTKAQIIGDEINTFLVSSQQKDDGEDLDYERKFNAKYNNAPNKAKHNYTDAPLFLEYSRLFSAKKVAFSLRPAQLSGIRFLTESGNAGILAHEVGFGKTTSSIAKISDMFQRGEASRILILAPTEEVYVKWFIEIQGSNETGDIGVLGQGINVIGLGNLDFQALRGSKTVNSQSEKMFGKYNGAFEYSDTQQIFIKKATEIGDDILSSIGGAGQRFIDYTEMSMLANTPILPKEKSAEYTNSPRDTPPVIWDKKTKPNFNKTEIISFNESEGVEYDIITDTYEFRHTFKDLLRIGSVSDFADKSKTAKNSFFVRVFDKAKEFVPEIEIDDLSGLWMYLEEIQQRYLQKARDYRKTITYKSNTFTLVGDNLTLAIPHGGYKGWRDEKWGKSVPAGKKDYDTLESCIEVLAEYFFDIALHVATDGKSNSAFIGTSNKFVTPKNAGMIYLLPSIRKSLLSRSAKQIQADVFNQNTSSSLLKMNDIEAQAFVDSIKQKFFTQKVEVYTPDQTDTSSLGWSEAQRVKEHEAARKNRKYVVNQLDIYEWIAKAVIAESYELEMTSELAEVMRNLKSISNAIGKLKPVALKPKTVFIALHTAVGKFKIPFDYVLESAIFMNDIPSDGIILDKAAEKTKLLNNVKENAEEYLTQASKSALYTNQINAISINRLGIDAMIVDEVHNFNRGFKKPQNLAFGVKVTSRDDSVEFSRKIRPFLPIRTTLNPQKDLPIQRFYAEAKYDIRTDIQNFGALSLYVKDVSQQKYSTPHRKVNNNIFLSATPFTDDNFQAYTLFGFINRELLTSMGISTLSNFYRLFANEVYKIDINIQGNVGLFPVIKGYKNTYILSRIIGTFADFAVSDVEIDKKRPKKIVIANTVSYPPNVGVDDNDFQNAICEIKEAKVNSFVPINDAQKKMKIDGSDYIVGKIPQPIRFTQDEAKKADEIYNEILDWKAKNPDLKQNAKMDAVLKALKNLFTKTSKTVDKVKIEKYVLIRDTDSQKAEELLEKGKEIDSANIQWRQYAMSYMSSDEDDININDLDLDDLNSGVSGVNSAQILASRTMQMANISALTLISPYFVTTDKQGAWFKKGDNPYLSSYPLNYKNSKGDFEFNSYQNAKRFVENSPKIYYTCESIANQIRYQIKQNEETGVWQKVSGSIVYSAYIQFTYHGNNFKIFDLMSVYLLNKHPDLFEKDHFGKPLPKNMTDKQKLEKFFVQIAGSGKAKNEVEQFNSGEAYVLFGSDRIKEGVDLQKNSAFLYILTIGYVPVTFMQLHGRMWRQGNPFKYCFIVNVLVKNSIDAFQYSKLDQKINAVRNMLESGVYDANETQFDVDVNEIKINLINDADKLAELQYETIKDDLSVKIKTMEGQLLSLSELPDDFVGVVDSYKVKAKVLADSCTKYSNLMFELLVEIEYQAKYNTASNSAKNSLAEKIWNKQAVGDGVNLQSKEGIKALEDAVEKHIKQGEAISKMTPENKEKTKKDKAFKWFYSLKSESQIKKEIDDTGKEFLDELNNIGVISREEIAQDFRAKPKMQGYNMNLYKPPLSVDDIGYLSYSVFEETMLFVTKNIYQANNNMATFITSYNAIVRDYRDYTIGKITIKDFVENLKSDGQIVYNKLSFVAQGALSVYILVQDVPTIDTSFDEIDEDFWTKKYQDNQGYQSDSEKEDLFKAVTVQRRDAIFAEEIRGATYYYDEVVDSDKTTTTLKTYERLIKGRGEDGGDLDLEGVSQLRSKITERMAEDEEKIRQPAKTKDALKVEYQKKLDQMNSQKEETMEEKLAQISKLYPLIEQK